MKELLLFFGETLIVSVLFFLGFRLIRNHTTPRFKRFYLIGWMVFSVLFPLVSLDTFTFHSSLITSSMQEERTTPTANELEESPMNNYTFNGPSNFSSRSDLEAAIKVNEKKSKLGQEQVILAIYLTVTLSLFGRILLGLFQIWRLKSISTKSELHGHEILEVNDRKFTGASFFSWIFIGKEQEQKDTIMQHELAHMKLFHSLDIMASHVYQALFWLNPTSWFLRKSIAVNTELEADNYFARQGGVENYINNLIDLSFSRNAVLMNHFSARNLKLRIMELVNPSNHKKWVSVFSVLLVIASFGIISCSKIDGDGELVMDERLNEVKSITTRFTSHQSDTQQKTGKIVSIATFNTDGTLDEFVTQTTYPYDREFEVKKEFWDEPIKNNLFYVMDGLTLDAAEKSFLYGNNWPKAYYKHLKKRESSEAKGPYPWSEKVSTDNENQPKEIKIERLEKENIRKGVSIISTMADITEFFTYENGRVSETAVMRTYKNLDNEDGTTIKTLSEKDRDFFASLKESSNKKKVTANYQYENELLASIKYEDNLGEKEFKFSYENGVLIKSEYYKNNGLVNSRFHYYKNGLKDRTEIFNIYNEPEYTITYSYEFW